MCDLKTSSNANTMVLTIWALDQNVNQNCNQNGNQDGNQNGNQQDPAASDSP